MKAALLMIIILSCQFKHSHASLTQIIQSAKELQELEQAKTAIYNVPVSAATLYTAYNNHRLFNPQATFQEFFCHASRDLQNLDNTIKTMQAIKLIQLASQAHAVALAYLSAPPALHYSAPAAQAVTPLPSISPSPAAASPSRPTAISPIPLFIPVPRLQMPKSPSIAIATLPSSDNSPT